MGVGREAVLELDSCRGGWRANRLNCPARWATPRNPNRLSRIDEYVHLAGIMGYELLDWQYDFLEVFSEVHTDGTPYYRTGVLLVPRQQGKTEVVGGLVAVHRVLYWDPQPQHVIWSAQSLVDAVAVFEDKIRDRLTRDVRFAKAAGWRFTLGNLGSARVRSDTKGSSIRLVSSGKSAGHGSSPGLVIVDEAWSEQNTSREQALRYAQRAQLDSQFLIISTAGDASSVYLQGVVDAGRARVEAGFTGRSMYSEWSADPEADPGLVETWRSCTPSLGWYVSEETMAQEFEDARDTGTMNNFRRGGVESVGGWGC